MRGLRGSRGTCRARSGRRCGCAGGAGLAGRRLLLLRGRLACCRGRVLSNLANDRGFDGRRRRPDELSLLLEVGEQFLALDPELLGELVDPDLGHISPCVAPRLGPWGHAAVTSAGGCSSLSTHRVLISVKPASGSSMTEPGGSACGDRAWWPGRCALRPRGTTGPSRLLLPQPRLQCTDVRPPASTQGPAERPALGREPDTGRVGVHVGTTTLAAASWVGDDHPRHTRGARLLPDDTQ
jgi:hypothetical protein